MKISIINISIFFFLVFYISCTNSASDPDYTEVLNQSIIDNNTFSNKFLELTITIPNGWKKISSQEIDSLKRKGIELVKSHSNNPTFKNLDPNKSDNQITILNTFKYDINKGQSINPSILIRVSHNSIYPDCQTGDLCAEFHRKVFAETGMYFNISPSRFILTSDATTLDYLTAEIKSNEVTLGYQNVYFIKSKDYIIFICATYQDLETKKEIEDIIMTVKAPG